MRPAIAIRAAKLRSWSSGDLGSLQRKNRSARIKAFRLINWLRSRPETRRTSASVIGPPPDLTLLPTPPARYAAACTYHLNGSRSPWTNSRGPLTAATTVGAHSL
jgi:hypothetical protein